MLPSFSCKRIMDYQSMPSQIMLSAVSIIRAGYTAGAKVKFNIILI